MRRSQIEELAADGFIAEEADGRLRVTPMGAPLLDTIVADLAV